MKRKFTSTYYFIILEKRISREHTKNQNAIQMSNFGLCDIIPSASQLVFHTYYVKYGNTLTNVRAQSLVGSRGMLF